MDLGKVATIIQALNACEVLFGDVKPNRFEVKSFKMTEGQIELFATKENAASFETQCPVLGNDTQLELVAQCEDGICPYLFGDAVYLISRLTYKGSMSFKTPRVIDMEGKQPNVSCDQTFGVDDVKRAFYFKKSGTCMHEFFDGFKNPWSPLECDSFVPITLEPDTPTQFYHLRHLIVVTGCQMPRIITENMIDNTFVQFTFIDPTVTALPISAFLTPNGFLMVVMGTLGMAIVLSLVVALIIVCVIRIKKSKLSGDQTKGHDE